MQHFTINKNRVFQAETFFIFKVN